MKTKFFVFALSSFFSFSLITSCGQNNKCPYENSYRESVNGNIVIKSIKDSMECKSLVTISYVFQTPSSISDNMGFINVPKSWIQAKGVKVGSTFLTEELRSPCAVIAPTKLKIPSDIPETNTCY